MKHQGSIVRAIAFLVIGALLGWQTNAVYTNENDQNDQTFAQSDSEESLSMGLFWDVWQTIQSDYFDYQEVDAQSQVYGAIAGLVSALDDPYSEFMDPTETTEFNNSLNGELEGIGAELTVKDGKLVIVSPLKNSPAELAGLLPGDHIFLINGDPTSEMTIFDAVMAIRGEQGTDVTLTILRGESGEPLEFTITRQEIQVESVELTYIEEAGKNIAHLSIYQFGDDTTNEFTKAVQDIELKSPDGLILDLRMNGGGYLDVSIEMLSEFFKEEVTAVIVKHKNEISETMNTSGGGQLTEIPMVVLIDAGSASASEIVAGALQDYARAKIMGEQSFGKGSVQELSNLSDGSSLRLTIAKWFTPNDRTIDELGITPDIVIEMEPPTDENQEDLQLNTAVDYLSTL
ncbi:MAG: S41 family peptidase [Candidatus Gracilibacteria bacterium]